VVDWEHTSEPIAKAGGQQGSFLPTWNAMKKLVGSKKVRAIGVSNFGIADLKAILPHAKDVPISCNQIEVHPWLPNSEVIAFARDHGIVTSCYSPFAGQKKDGATLIVSISSYSPFSFSKDKSVRQWGSARLLIDKTER
jgi:diketogulonate reductase-like aldo/keto reductase